MMQFGKTQTKLILLGIQYSFVDENGLIQDWVFLQSRSHKQQRYI